MRLFSIAVQSSGWGCSSIHNHFGADSDANVERVSDLGRNRSAQNPANGGAAGLQAASDLGFADASAVQLPHLIPMQPGRYWPPQLFPVLLCVRQSGSNPLTQNLPLEFGKDGQQAG